MRRSNGNGTVQRHRGRWLARLPDDRRTPMGIFDTREDAGLVLDAAVHRLRTESMLFGKFLCCPVVDWPERRGVYVITTRDKWPMVKVGRSGNIADRLKKLQLALGPIGLLAILSGRPQDERATHKLFELENVEGEWFAAVGRVHAAIVAARRVRQWR